ncbi:hypothetical protein [Halalkalibacter urbisdiaboli]|uniref:hypothetical protein n=1 Tax=Halalkalibacter urbisdiaboli TaxID=1960589 RepID=UPI000B4300B9|nr:hypothetical protein [Halalkalibacter urbisdiaboli]
MYTTGLHVIGPTTHYGHGFHYGYIWHHPGFYLGHGYNPGVHHGHHWYNKPQEPHHYQMNHEMKAQNKPTKPQSIYKHDYQFNHHGYSFGQSSGSFPEYYNHNY